MADNFFNRLGQTFRDSFSSISDQTSSALNASASSAIEAERQATAEANAFNAAQAAINRQFQQASADRSMQFEAEQAQIAREFAASEAQKQRDYEERLSNTSYQRAMKDLQSAGLNPLLLYSNLSAASTPSGSSASSFSAHGASSSGSSASGFKSDISKAKSADLGVLNNLIPLLAITGISSALDAFKGYTVSESTSKKVANNVLGGVSLLLGSPVAYVGSKVGSYVYSKFKGKK